MSLHTLLPSAVKHLSSCVLYTYIETMNAQLNDGDALDIVAALMKHHINSPRTHV